MMDMRKGKVIRVEPVADGIREHGVIKDMKTGNEFPFETEKGAYKLNQIIYYNPGYRRDKINIPVRRIPDSELK